MRKGLEMVGRGWGGSRRGGIYRTRLRIRCVVRYPIQFRYIKKFLPLFFTGNIYMIKKGNFISIYSLVSREEKNPPTSIRGFRGALMVGNE